MTELAVAALHLFLTIYVSLNTIVPPIKCFRIIFFRAFFTPPTGKTRDITEIFIWNINICLYIYYNSL